MPIDRLPPHSIEAEQGVLGCILWAPNDCVPECVQRLGVEGALAFYDLRHQTLYETLVGMFDTREAIDFITLSQRLKDENQLESIGGLAYLTSLQDCIPSAANLPYYLGILEEKYTLRRLIRTCSETIGKVYEEGDGISRERVGEVLDNFETEALAIRGKARAGRRTMRELCLARVDACQARAMGEVPLGISTGFRDFDKVTGGGLHLKELMVLGARPSVGKTAWAMNVMDYIAVTQQIPVGVFSLEMSAESLTDRLIIARSGMDGGRFNRANELTDKDFQRITAANGALVRAPMHIDDTSDMSILELRSRARQMVAEHGVKVIMVDYLQLLTANGKTIRSEFDVVTHVSKGLKAMAKELGVAVMVLCQLNREIEKRGPTAEPRMSDLRQTGQIEQDADIIAFLWRTEEPDKNRPLDPVNLGIRKQRNGPGHYDCHLLYKKANLKFESAVENC